MSGCSALRNLLALTPSAFMHVSVYPRASGKPCDSQVHESKWLCGGTLARRARAWRAPGIFFDPCPTGGLLPLICWATLYGFAPWPPGHQQIWDGYGPSRTRGDFFDFEVGGHDGAYKGRIHVIVPLIGRKNGTLTARQQCYNDVHGWYRARIEQLFARLWHAR